MKNRNEWTQSFYPLLLVLALSACGPTEAERAALAEKKRIECLDKYCEGDKEPAYDWAKETRFKVNGQWFVMSKDYGSPNFGGFGFTWPSKTPLATSLPGGYPDGPSRSP
ncbi:hypothetical protein [Candidatus Accumulibacter vicinus]|uniref:Lipoprotein n=1 Tax=Candidatus Accumulibacter vicinus TaxID=2954382 RepID=A0A084XXX9_9PROT|nr:hypothetical protein [Candidatus Accumulibacter vicinus]KFB67323.1 MAG: hypothetical protein CAPSK01_003441 [Candidatus Accumulibacter vicinus]